MELQWTVFVQQQGGTAREPVAVGTFTRRVAAGGAFASAAVLCVVRSHVPRGCYQAAGVPGQQPYDSAELPQGAACRPPDSLRGGRVGHEPPDQPPVVETLADALVDERGPLRAACPGRDAGRALGGALCPSVPPISLAGTSIEITTFIKAFPQALSTPTINGPQHKDGPVSASSGHSTGSDAKLQRSNTRTAWRPQPLGKACPQTQPLWRGKRDRPDHYKYAGSQQQSDAKPHQHEMSSRALVRKNQGRGKSDTAQRCHQQSGGQKKHTAYRPWFSMNQVSH